MPSFISCFTTLLPCRHDKRLIFSYINNQSQLHATSLNTCKNWYWYLQLGHFNKCPEKESIDSLPIYECSVAKKEMVLKRLIHRSPGWH